MLPKLLIVDDEPELRELVALGLSARFEVEILECGSGNEAIELLKQNPDIDVLICDYAMPNGNGSDVLDHIATMSVQPAFIFFTSYYSNQISEKDLSRSDALITKPCLDGSLNKYVEQILNKKRNKVPSKNLGYVKLRKDWLLALPRAYADYYVKLTDDHYVLFVKRGTDATDIGYERLIEKEDKFVYVLGSEGEGLVSAMMQRLDLDTHKPEEGDWKAEVNWIAEMTEIAHKFQKSLGWSPEIEKVAAKSLEQVERRMQQLPSLRDFLLRMKASSSHKLYQHTSMLAYVVTGLLLELKAVKNYGDAELRSLAAAALIHDIALTESIHDKRFKFRAQIASKEEGKGEEFATYRDHPELATHVAAAWKGMPDVVEELVMQHHERPDGTGFPFGLKSDQIPALSCIFIIAHELTEFAIESPQPLDFSKFYEERKAQFGQGLFGEILEKLRKSLKS